MSSDGDSSNRGPSATDIITYIGVPLAVLGVLPILYNTFATLASLSRIQRMLRRSRLTALTRSDVVNRVIEIELPRYAVKPWDRYQNQEEYWGLSRHPSSIPGGSWTTFNWKTNTIGIKTQRVEYADQVRQPQVDVAFDDLVCYLLDLGAVPDAHGWKLLRSTGLWTPVGCSLMTSPGGTEKALTVGPQHDADGNLSLVVSWSSEWTTRDHGHLPPYWIRLPAQPRKASEEISEQDQSQRKSEDEDKKTIGNEEVSTKPVEEESDPMKQDDALAVENDYTCQILASGITSALSEGDLYSDTSSASCSIDHLRIHPGRTDGVWFASAASAYGTTGQTVLWNFKIPDDILAFARKESVPCGIMVLLDIVAESETPDWCTTYNDNGASLDQFMRRNRERALAVQAESRMAPAERAAAQATRMERERHQMMQDMRDSAREQQQRAEKRMMEALQSPKWNTRLVAQYCLQWLQAQGTWDTSQTTKDVVGFILHRMIYDTKFASDVVKMLDSWKSWTDIGGMKRSDFLIVQENRSIFAHATLLIAMIMDTSSALEGTLSMDMQECLRLWNKVRLG